MKLLTLFFLLFLNKTFYGQQSVDHDCKIEIYLLKKNINNADSLLKGPGQFKAAIEDLQETALINNEEIITYTIEKNRLYDGKHTITRYQHYFQLRDSSIKKLNDKVPGWFDNEQFALVVNNKIIYTGWLINSHSSVIPRSVTASTDEQKLYISFGWKNMNDPRKNKSLMSCLDKTKRLIRR